MYNKMEKEGYKYLFRATQFNKSPTRKMIENPFQKEKKKEAGHQYTGSLVRAWSMIIVWSR